MEPDVFESDLGADLGFIVADLVDLQANEARRRHAIGDARARRIVEECFDRRADGFDAEMVPVIGFEDSCALLRELSAIATQLARIQPKAATLVVNPRRPPPFLRGIRINLHLISMHVARRDVERLLLPLDGGVMVENVASELDT